MDRDTLLISLKKVQEVIANYNNTSYRLDKTVNKMYYTNTGLKFLAVIFGALWYLPAKALAWLLGPGMIHIVLYVAPIVLGFLGYFVASNSRVVGKVKYLTPSIIMMPIVSLFVSLILGGAVSWIPLKIIPFMVAIIGSVGANAYAGMNLYPKLNYMINGKKFDQIGKQITDLENSLQILNVKCGKLTGTWYPPKYVHADAANKFVQYVSNRRADTIKEAVNLYEVELHSNEVLKENQRQSDELRRQTAEMQTQSNIQRGILASSVVMNAQLRKANSLLGKGNRLSSEANRMFINTFR